MKSLKGGNRNETNGHYDACADDGIFRCFLCVGGRRENGQAIYHIKDNGIGIAKEHQDKIYELFHRLNPEASAGEGLGLTIARRIIDRHAGKIWIESEQGKGSTFFVSLPVS